MVGHVPQLDLVALALGDVLHVGEDVAGLVALADGGRLEQHPHGLAVDAQELRLAGVARPEAGDHVAQGGAVGLGVIGVGEVADAPADERRHRVAEHVGEGVVDLQEAALEVEQGHADRGVVEGGPEALLGFVAGEGQGVLDGDVLEVDEQVHVAVRRIGRAPDRHAAATDAALGQQQAALEPRAVAALLGDGVDGADRVGRVLSSISSSTFWPSSSGTPRPR